MYVIYKLKMIMNYNKSANLVAKFGVFTVVIVFFFINVFFSQKEVVETVKTKKCTAAFSMADLDSTSQNSWGMMDIVSHIKWYLAHLYYYGSLTCVIRHAKSNYELL